MLRSMGQAVFRGKVKGVCPSPLNYNPFHSSQALVLLKRDISVSDISILICEQKLLGLGFGDALHEQLLLARGGAAGKLHFCMQEL
jgi:hypothetical protein